MALTQTPERRSIRIVSTNGAREVLSASASYSDRMIDCILEFLDPEYCAANPAEVQSALSSFIGALNVLLKEARLPRIQPEAPKEPAA